MKHKIKFRGLPVLAISLVTNEQTNKSAFIILKNEKAVVESILEYLMNSEKGHSVYNFEFIPEKSVTDIVLSNVLNGKNFKYLRRLVIQSPYLSCKGGWDEYFTSRSRRFKKKINYLNNLFKNNSSQIVVYKNDGLDKGIEEMINISKNTWKYEKNTAIASDSKNSLFYKLLAKAAENKGWLDFSILRLNGIPVAFEFNLAYKKTFYAVKTGFNAKFSRFSPSNFLAFHVIKKCFNDGFQEYDLLGNNDQYKMEWTSSIRRHYQYLIFNGNLRSRFAFIIESAIVPFLKKCILKK
jgi:hypothetical protein